MSEHLPKTFESCNSEVDQIRKRTPRTSLWFAKEILTIWSKVKKQSVMVKIVIENSVWLIVSKRRESKPQMETRPLEEMMFSKSDSSASSSLGFDKGAWVRWTEDMAIGDWDHRRRSIRRWEWGRGVRWVRVRMRVGWWNHVRVVASGGGNDREREADMTFWEREEESGNGWWDFRAI